MVKPPKCPNCQQNMVKNGHTRIFVNENGFRTSKRKKKQKYICKSCHKVITNIGNFHPKLRYSNDKIAFVLEEYFFGKTWIRLENKESINRSTMYKWSPRFCNLMYMNMKDRLRQGKYSGHLIIDIYYIDMRFRFKERQSKGEDEKTLKDYPKAYLWSCIDIGTRTIVAMHVSEHRTIEECKEFLKEFDGLTRPKFIFSDNEMGFVEPIEQYFNKGQNRGLPRVEHLAINKSDPLHKPLHGKTNLIERYHEKIEAHIKHRRRLFNLKTAQIYFRMFVLCYNFIMVHSKIRNAPTDKRGITPVEKAGIGIPKQSKDHMKDVMNSLLYTHKTLAET